MTQIIGAMTLGAAWLLTATACAQTLAQFHTPVGDLLVELADTDKPVTVQNFLRYVSQGRYQNMFIHRWEPGFVIQGDGYHTSGRFTADPGIAAVPDFGTITNEFSIGRRLSNLYATIAMARVAGMTDSASSQWFFNLADNVALDAVDGGFTVFGRVVAGTNALERFNNVSLTNGIYRISLGAPLDKLPVVLAAPTNSPTFEDLVNVDISLPARPRLQLSAHSAGGWRLAWNSVSNVINRLEAATSLPAVWQTLIATNGNGGVMEMVDPTTAAQRFYRVRLD
jgi:cyclophilin family peptidyl-prolyl cis-trans isomerase